MYASWISYARRIIWHLPPKLKHQLIKNRICKNIYMEVTVYFFKRNFTFLQHNIIMISKFTICTCIDIFIDIFIHALPIACRCCQSKKTLEGVNIAIFGSNMIWKSYYIHVHLYDIFFHIMNFFYHFFYHFKCFVIESKKKKFVHVFSSFKIL